jgi:hypothetical protein
VGLSLLLQKQLPTDVHFVLNINFLKIVFVIVCYLCKYIGSFVNWKTKNSGTVNGVTNKNFFISISSINIERIFRGVESYLI